MDLEDVLRGLHKNLADKMVAELSDPECKPATFTAIAKFLKDNNIVHVPESKDALQDAAKKYEGMGDELDEADSKHLDFPKAREA
jgi:hypothetical protein